MRATSKGVSDFVREQQLDKKAAAAYEDASQQLRTSYMRLDAEWDLAGRMSNLQGRVKETAQVSAPDEWGREAGIAQARSSMWHRGGRTGA